MFLCYKVLTEFQFIFTIYLSNFSIPNDGKGIGKVLKCYSNLTGKNILFLTCYLSTLIAKECVIVYLRVMSHLPKIPLNV